MSTSPAGEKKNGKPTITREQIYQYITLCASGQVDYAHARQWWRKAVRAANPNELADAIAARLTAR